MQQTLAVPSLRRAVVLGVCFFLAVVPLLIVAPYWFPPAADVVSAATAVGYNNGAASLLAVLWAGGGVVLFWLLARITPPAESPESPTPADRQAASPTRWRLMALGLAAGILLLYCPFFLARYGPFVEDQVFLTALQRMHGGQLPFKDFEFLYGPLMIYPAFWWTRLVGYSMTAVYGYLALIEILFYLLLLHVVRRFVRDRARQLTAFLLLAALQFNTLLAPNQNGLRKFLPIYAVLLVAERPESLVRILGGGALLGLQLAYSQEFGVAGLIGLIAMYGLLALRREGWIHIARGALLGAVASATWFVAARLVTGATFGDYLSETLSLVARFSAGEAGFRFYWTANSLALFALIALGCASVGTALARPLSLRSSAGDRMLMASLVYTLVGLKSGLNRCDLWHLDPAVLALVTAFLIQTPRRLIPELPRTRTLAFCIVALLAFTYSAGQAPTGSYYLSGLVRGARDVLTGRGRPPRPDIATDAPTINFERSHPNEYAVQLSQYFAEATRRGRPVLFYGNEWALGPHIGVYKTDHLNDNFIYSAERGHALQTFLADRSDALVVMDRATYQRLYGLAGPRTVTESRAYSRLTPMKAIASWLSSVHYRGVGLEYGIRERRWQEDVGDYVRDHFRFAAQFGEHVVLAREAASVP